MNESDKRTSLAVIVALFIGVRVVLLMTLPAEGLFQYGDFWHYYRLAAWSVPGQCLVGNGACLPLIDYWYEFPPIFPYLSILIYQMVGAGGPAPFHAYAYGVAGLMLAADVGSLLLFAWLARWLYEPSTAERLAWAYALVPAPLILGWWTFDSLTTFWILLALWAVLRGRDAQGAVALGLGIATKLIPGLLLPAIWRARTPRRGLAIAAGAAGVVLAILAPFLWRAPAVVVASLRAQASKASYATIWAMIDGNLQTAAGQPITGNFGPLIERFDLTRATTPLHNPARLPGWMTLAVAAGVFAAVWISAGRQRAGQWDDRAIISLAAFTVAVFLVWSKGWSPQWQQWIVPMILLTRPDRTGVLLALALAFVSFLEWPVLLSRGLVWGYYLTIPLRTALFIGWGADLARQLAGRSKAVTE